jgi:hypothetical protein
MDVLFRQVHVSIAQLQSHLDVRKRALEFRDNGQNVAATRTAGAVMICSP